MRAMDFELPDEWMENPDLFIFKDYDTTKSMIEDLRQPITVENAVREMRRMEDAKRRYLEGKA